MGNDNNFAEAFRRLRIASGFTLKRLSQNIEVDTAYLQKIEYGKEIPSLSILNKMIHIMELTQTESDLLYFLAKQLPPDSNLFTSFSAFRKVLGILRNDPDLDSVEHPTPSDNPIHHVTTPGEIVKHWRKGATTVRNLFRYKKLSPQEYRRSGRTHLVLISAIYSLYGPPRLPLPFSFSPEACNLDSLYEVSVLTELVTKHKLKSCNVRNHIKRNIRYKKFEPNEFRKSGGDLLFLNHAIENLHRTDNIPTK